MISAWWLLVAVILTAISTVFTMVVIAVAYANKDIDDQWGREFEMEKRKEVQRMAGIETKFHEIASIFSAVGNAPSDCTEYIAYHAECHISPPCGGSFDCDYRKEQMKGGGKDV